MFASASSGRVCFVHALPEGDSDLTTTVKLLDSTADSVTTVRVAADNATSWVDTVRSPPSFDAVYAAVPFTSDALGDFLTNVLKVLTPGGRYFHSLKVGGWQIFGWRSVVA
jgi:hypothetical protein